MFFAKKALTDHETCAIIKSSLKKQQKNKPEGITMNKGLTTQEQITLAKEILQVKNRRERSLKLGEILDREKLSSDDMYELYNTLLTTIRVYGDVIGFDDKDFQEMALTILVLEKVEEAKQARVA